MNPSNDSSPSSSEPLSIDTELTQSIGDLEEGVLALRRRHDEVIQAQTEKQELRVRINRAQSELRQHRTKQLREELNTLQNRLEEVDLTLESRLFAWSSLKEPFWQIVRFGGIGIVIGWVMRSLT